MADSNASDRQVPPQLDPAKGGKARAEKLSPEEREEIARRAAEARWSKDLPLATHGSPDHPLRIGDVEIPCYVLEDGRRVLHQRGMVGALGMSRGSSGSTGGDRLAKFVSGDRLKPFISSKLIEVTQEPIKFKIANGQQAYGYEATVLADICEAVLAARKAGVLQAQQLHIAEQCEILVRGFARVGIVALVDEATGYQYDRTRKALHEILERFIAKELLKWAKRFPDEFYEEMFRLKTWEYHRPSSKRPVQAGKLTNDVVYERLAPGVLDELKRLTPRDDKGRLKHKYHQRLTEDIGHPRLREHLTAVIALMRAFDDWGAFYKALNRSLPKQVEVPLLTWAEEQVREEVPD